MGTYYSLGDPENKLVVPSSRTNAYLKNNFNYSGASIWNSLPWNLWQASFLKKLKHLVRLKRKLKVNGWVGGSSTAMKEWLKRSITMKGEVGGSR